MESICYLLKVGKKWEYLDGIFGNNNNVKRYSFIKVAFSHVLLPDVSKQPPVSATYINNNSTFSCVQIPLFLQQQSDNVLYRALQLIATSQRLKAFKRLPQMETQRTPDLTCFGGDVICTELSKLYVLLLNQWQF